MGGLGLIFVGVVGLGFCWICYILGLKLGNIVREEWSCEGLF